MSESKHKLNNKDLWKIAWRINFMRLTLNYETLNGMGFMRTIAPALAKIYPNKRDLSEAMNRHRVFYNSHINFDGGILTLAAAMEETTGPDEKDSINALKTGLMGPFAGLGDSLVKMTWTPIVGSIGASLAFAGNVFGPILMFILYNIVNIGGRLYAVFFGYHKGMDFLKNNQHSDAIKRISTMANVVGLMVVGALIATVVKVSTPIKFAVHSTISNKISTGTISLQSMFDKIMPGLLSLAVTVVSYLILKKTNGKHAALLIVIMMALVVVLSYFKIL